MKKICVIFFVVSACATRAPSAYELDRRAGLLPAFELENAQHVGRDLARIPPLQKTGEKPIRTLPWYEKVWVYDHEVEGGYWLQGTYIFLEVEPGRWVRPEEAK